MSPLVGYSLLGSSKITGYPLVCDLGRFAQLRNTNISRPHPALQELGAIGVIDELSTAARSKNQYFPEPILITVEATILCGIGRWRLAVFEGKDEIDCLEYPLSDDESLTFIVAHHLPRHGWDPFIRICLALTLESTLQQKAFNHMRDGGKYKGWAKLPEAQHINVRREIARTAGVSDRNVSNVKMILENAHPRVVEALQNGTLTINRALQFCKLPKAHQVEEFAGYIEDREISRVIRQAIPAPGHDKTTPEIATVLHALQEREERQPGSVVVRVGRLQHTVVLIGQDLLSSPHSQTEMKFL